MTDDIVTRLRECVVGDPDEYTWWTTMEEAADEIERLRADRDRWRNAAHTLADHIANTSSDSPAETILRDAYEAACGI